MRGKTLSVWIFLALVVLWVPLGIILNVAGIATIEGDAGSIASFFVRALEAAVKWLTGPPVWLSTSLLVLMVFAFIHELMGWERSLRLLRVLFRKSARIAEFQNIADNRTVLALQMSTLARAALEDTNWEPQPPLQLPHATSPAGYLSGTSLPGDYLFTLLPRDYSNIERRPILVLDAIVHRGSAIHDRHVLAALQEKSASFCQRIVSAGEQVLKESELVWQNIEQGRVFRNNEDRRQWHFVRGKIGELNNVMAELKLELERIADSWKSVPDAAVVQSLLNDLQVSAAVTASGDTVQSAASAT